MPCCVRQDHWFYAVAVMLLTGTVEEGGQHMLLFAGHRKAMLRARTVWHIPVQEPLHTAYGCVPDYRKYGTRMSSQHAAHNLRTTCCLRAADVCLEQCTCAPAA